MNNNIKRFSVLGSRFSASYAGFSLIEVIIAMAILIVGLVGIMYFFPVGLKASRRAGVISEISFLAETKLEEIKAASYDSVVSSPPKIAMEGIEGNYKWTLSIDEVSLPELERPNDIRKVTLSIDWTEDSKARSKNFVEFIARN